MKIALTGASGMLGHAIVRVFSKKHVIAGLDIRDVPEHDGITEKCDLTNAVQVSKVMDKIAPDMVIHTAAWTDVDGCEKDPDRARRVNAGATDNVAAYCAAFNVPMILISTDFVFSGDKGSPYTENDETSPLSVYGKTKVLAENELKEKLEDYCVIRTGWLYGGYGKNFVDTVADKIVAGENLKVVNDQTGAPTYVDDLAEGILRLIENKDSIKGGNIYNITNAGECSWYALAVKIADISVGRSDMVTPINSDELDRPAKRPCFSVLDNAKFIKDSGTSLRPWDEALEYYLSNKRKPEKDEKNSLQRN